MRISCLSLAATLLICGTVASGQELPTTPRDGPHAAIPGNAATLQALSAAYVEGRWTVFTTHAQELLALVQAASGQMFNLQRDYVLQHEGLAGNDALVRVLADTPARR